MAIKADRNNAGIALNLCGAMNMEEVRYCSGFDYKSDDEILLGYGCLQYSARPGHYSDKNRSPERRTDILRHNNANFIQFTSLEQI